MAYRHQLRRHLARLKVIESRERGGAKEVRTARVLVSSRHERAAEPLARLWLPKLEWVSADLFVDRIHGRLHLSGDGPFHLARRRVLQKLLDAILQSDGLAIRVDELFERVWGGAYDPLAHEERIERTGGGRSTRYCHAGGNDQ